MLLALREGLVLLFELEEVLLATFATNETPRLSFEIENVHGQVVVANGAFCLVNRMRFDEDATTVSRIGQEFPGFPVINFTHGG